MLPPDKEIPATIAFTLADAFIALVLAMAGAGVAWVGSHRIEYGLRGPTTTNVWFESDVGRVYGNMSSRWTNHFRATVHPIFSLLAVTTSKALARVGHLNLDEAVNASLAGTAALWSALLYLLAIRLGFERLLSVSGVILGLTSASSLFFLTVPETYGMASVSVVACILIAVSSQNTRWAEAGAIVASACSLSITVTNWMVGLLVTFRRRKFRWWMQVSINAFFLVTILWTVQKYLISTAPYFTDLRSEQAYTISISATRVWRVGCAFLFHSLVAPAAMETTDFGVGEYVGPDWQTALSFQNAWPGSASFWGLGAVILWAIVLLVGAWSMIRARSRIPMALLTYLAFELVLHMIYGIETFMYALDWLPVLLIVGLYGVRQLKQFRWPVLALLIVLVAINNLREFEHVTGMLRSYAQQHPVYHPSTTQELGRFLERRK